MMRYQALNYELKVRIYGPNKLMIAFPLNKLDLSPSILVKFLYLNFLLFIVVNWAFSSSNEVEKWMRVVANHFLGITTFSINLVLFFATILSVFLFAIHLLFISPLYRSSYTI